MKAHLSTLGLSGAQEMLYESLVARPGDIPEEFIAGADFGRLAELGLLARATTRFQAGYQAVQRDWLTADGPALPRAA
ncbi:hypothetical protein [Micromonospora sp. NPDC001898]|uniref:hypothetical protein n=1 Tax=Micromonospora sp. NPDC001898 TaxID=3364221 RepID=UPI00369AD5E9